MYRTAALAVLAFAAVAAGQQLASPPIPQPINTPIVGPDGRIMSGMDGQAARSPWSASVDLGLSGSDGNSQVIKLWTGADLKFDGPEDYFVANVFYGLSQQDGILNENKVLATARNEYPFAEALFWYSQVQYEYDDFRLIDQRLALHSGISTIGYRDDKLHIRLRAGMGASREIGREESRWLPEAQFGFDYEYKLSERTKFVAAADYYPDVEEFAHYRIRGRAFFDILIDPGLGLALRVGAQDRYDARPGKGIKKNDLDYFLTLVLRF
jgi:putative salt-induced outer membrane protein YdiY